MLPAPRPLQRLFCGAAAGCSGASAGQHCAPGEVCAAGACALSCPASLVECGNTQYTEQVWLDMEEIYGGVFDGDLNPMSEELVTKPAPWLTAVPAGAEFVSADADMLLVYTPQITKAPRALAGAIGVIASKDFEAGKAIEAAAAGANYVRRSDAEMFTISYRPLKRST